MGKGKPEKPGKTLDQNRTRERALWADGQTRVAGVDEAGIGPLAGPVVAAAVILPNEFEWNGVNDSKKLTAKRREALYPVLCESALDYSIAVVDIEEIDALNIYHAGLLAMRRAIENLEAPIHHALVDGREIPNVPWARPALWVGMRKN